MFTALFDEVSERGYRDTPKGMAFWTGTGPVGEKCKDCAHFSGKAGKSGVCAKTVRALVAQKSRAKAQKFPGSVAACKYFERR